MSTADLALARRVSPERFLRRHHPEVRVERQGRTVVVPGRLRADFAGDHWVACDWGGGGIGDGVALVRHVLGCSFVEAVRHLLGNAFGDAGAAAVVHAAGKITIVPAVPPCSDPQAGREYLASRGLMPGIVAAAESGRSLRYLKDGVAFLGRDVDDTVRSVTVRFFQPKTHAAGMLTKRDLRGSNKSFPVLFDGSPDRAVVVEGSLSGLAVQCLAVLGGREPPTVVVTGGVNALRWLGEPGTRASRLVVEAAELTVGCENELLADGLSDAAKQACTDGARTRLSAAIVRARGGPPRMAYPPAGCRDAADWLVLLRRERGV